MFAEKARYDDAMVYCKANVLGRAVDGMPEDDLWNSDSFVNTGHRMMVAVGMQVMMAHLPRICAGVVENDVLVAVVGAAVVPAQSGNANDGRLMGEDYYQVALNRKMMPLTVRM